MIYHPSHVPDLPAPIFNTPRRWALTSTAELSRLQTALTQCVELAGPDPAQELLTLVTGELDRRNTETTGSAQPATLRHRL